MSKRFTKDKQIKSQITLEHPQIKFSLNNKLLKAVVKKDHTKNSTVCQKWSKLVAGANVTMLTMYVGATF